MSFKKAEKKQARLKMAISGPSGSGKTYSALRLAKGLGGKVAVIDTENGSASLYSDRFDFDVMEVQPPFTPQKYIDAIELAIKQGYSILIVDSVSHVWSGEGGLLQEKESLDSRGGNSYTNWAKMTPKWNRFVSSVLHSDIHMICTMRSKQDYILETNDKGKQAPRKVGLAPQVRDGFEYEFTVVFDVSMNHEAQTSKDRTGLFLDSTFQVNEKTGETIRRWLDAGVPAPKEKIDASHPIPHGPVASGPSTPSPVTPKAPSAPDPQPTADAPRFAGQAERTHVMTLVGKNGWSMDDVIHFIDTSFKKKKIFALTMPEYHELTVAMSVPGTPGL